MIGLYPSEIIRVICALLSPFVAVYGGYIIVHGHYGPGGGFAGGVFLALSAIMPRMTLPEELSYRVEPPQVGPLVGGLGMLLFLTAGTIPMLTGGAFLDYGAVEIAGLEPSRVRYLGIMVVEVSIGLSVAGSLLLIFDVITGRLRR